MSAAASTTPRPVRGPGRSRSGPRAGNPVQRAGLGISLVFLLPYLLLFGTFVLAPVVYGLYISLHSWDFMLPGKPFIGMDNYADLFSGSVTGVKFWTAMKATGIFVVLSVPLLIVIPLALAIALNKKFRGRNFFRAVVFAPFVLGVAIIGLLWRYLLDPTVGVVNYFLDKIGIDPIPFTTSLPWVWVALIVPTLWWTAGYNMVIFLAGLQDIPNELYEAADLDRANAWQKFWNVTLPSLRPVVVFVLTITVLASANVFGQPYLITKGQPGDETRTAIMTITDEGLKQFNMGKASAMSTIMTVALLAVSGLIMAFMRERTTKKGSA